MKLFLIFTIFASLWQNNDLSYFKYSMHYKQKFPEWDLLAKESKPLLMGYVISCNGICEIKKKGEGTIRVGYYSIVESGDDFITKDGEAWIFLMDGSILRVSRNSFFTFSTMLVSRAELLIYLNIRQGNLFILKRDNISTQSTKESDYLFYPLDILGWQNASLTSLEKYKKLSYVNTIRPTRLLLGTPSGFFEGQNPNVTIFVTDKVYLKADNGEFISDGYRDQLIDENWYQVDSYFSRYDGGDLDSSDLIVSNIPSIRLAADILFDNYAKDIFFTSNLDINLLKSKGYRLWGDIADSSSDGYFRYQYLIKGHELYKKSNEVVDISMYLKKELELYYKTREEDVPIDVNKYHNIIVKRKSDLAKLDFCCYQNNNDEYNSSK